MSATSRIDDRLRLARLGRGLSQVALADQAGVTRQTISGIEAGRWSPSLDVALAIAAALGSSVEELFGGAPSFKPQEARLAVGTRQRSRLLLATMQGEEVAFPLQDDHVLVPGFRPALAEVDGGRSAAPGLAGSSVQARRFVTPGAVWWSPAVTRRWRYWAARSSVTVHLSGFCGGTAAMPREWGSWMPAWPT